MPGNGESRSLAVSRNDYQAALRALDRAQAIVVLVALALPTFVLTRLVPVFDGLRRIGSATLRVGDDHSRWIAGLAVCLIVFTSFFGVFVVLMLIVDRRVGIRCPHCGRSTTLRCRAEHLIQTGKCCFCDGIVLLDGS